MKKMTVILFFLGVILIQVQVVMAQEVWVFGTKAQVFTQAYKIKNAWTIKHYLIDSGRGFEAKISKGLSANKQKAMQQIKQRFAKHKTQWVSLGINSPWFIKDVSFDNKQLNIHIDFNQSKNSSSLKDK
jgi:hypothetical protein